MLEHAQVKGGKNLPPNQRQIGRASSLRPLTPIWARQGPCARLDTSWFWLPPPPARNAQFFRSDIQHRSFQKEKGDAHANCSPPFRFIAWLPGTRHRSNGQPR